MQMVCEGVAHTQMSASLISPETLVALVMVAIVSAATPG